MTMSMYEKVLAVTDRKLCTRPFPEQIHRVCGCRPKALVLREKDLTPQAYRELAEQVLEICGEYQVDCILHNFTGAARELGVKRIHLPLKKLLSLSAEEKAAFAGIGTSVHSPEQARQALEAGAAWLFAGHIYESQCKAGLPPRGLEFLREICRLAGTVPVYAIGGIRRSQAQIREIQSCGAAGACIMSEMMKL